MTYQENATKMLQNTQRFCLTEMLEKFANTSAKAQLVPRKKAYTKNR